MAYLHCFLYLVASTWDIFQPFMEDVAKWNLGSGVEMFHCCLWMQLCLMLEGKESAVMYCGGERGDVLQENTTSPFHNT